MVISKIISIVTSSQPVLTGNTVESNNDSCNAAVESFTQPSRFDELIIGTQVPCTPGGSQVKRENE